MVALAQACAGAAFAQAQPASGAELDTVIVTARKTRENIITTPVAITAVSGQTLDAKGVINIQGLQDFTPGFRIVNQTFSRNDRGYSTYVMRGIYGGDLQPRQPVRIFIDGVPIASGMVSGLAGIDRVEVVEGPQSAYFGRSTFAGAVNFITKTPSLTDFKADASADFANNAYIEAKGSVEGPVIKDKVALRLSARYYTYDGSWKNQGGPGNLGGQSTKSIAGTLYLKPVDSLRIKGFAQYWQDDDGPPVQGVLTAPFYNCNPLGGAVFTYTCGAIKKVPASTLFVRNTFPVADVTALTAPNITTNLDRKFSNQIGLQRKAWQAFTSFEYDLPADWMLSGNAGGSDNQFLITIDGFQQPAPTNFVLDTPQHMKDYSGELRLTTPTWFDRAKVVVGVNYLHTSVVAIASGKRGASPIANLTDPSITFTRTLGFFGALHVDLTDKLKLDLEGREQQDEITQKVAPNANSSATAVAVSAHKTFSSFTPKAILSYQIDPDFMIYASYAKGNRPGSFNTGFFSLSPAIRAAIQGQTSVSLAVGPENLAMYELGLKGQFLDNRLRVLADVYYGDWTDRQVTASIFYLPPGATSNTFINLITGNSNVHLYGVEGKAEFKVTSDLSVEGTLAYNESDIRSTYCVNCNTLTGVPNPVGNRLPAYPAWTGSASVNYGHDIGNDLRAYVGVDYIYTGRQYDSEANLAWTPAANRVNARVGLTRNRYTVEVFGRNIFSDKTPTSLFNSANALTGVGRVIIASPPEKALFGIHLAAAY